MRISDWSSDVCSSDLLDYRYLETDVHATADGVLVAFHDETLDRVTDRRGRLSDLPWAEVARARIHGGHGISKLEELLAAWPDVRINIDPKTDRAAALLPDLLRRTESVDRVCVGSFSDARTARVRAAVELGRASCRERLWQGV